MKSDEIKNLIINTFREEKNSHAFLFVTNNLDYCLNDVKEIIRVINCNNDGSEDCDCNTCRTIKSDNNPDVMIISPDGKEIKKDQVLSVIDRFSTKPLINKYSTYVMNNCDRINDSSANKILKFLEEPEGNVIGFFITDKIQNVLPTIKSRCEIYNYDFEKKSILDILEISEGEYSSYFDLCNHLILLLNDNIKYMLMSESKILAKKERFELDMIFVLLRKIYVLKYENIMFNKYIDNDLVLNLISKISSDDLNLIVKRIKILDNMIDDLKFNVNKELVINKFFIIWE